MEAPHTPIHYHKRALPLADLAGLNLVAKEFLASRDDEDGVLVLSALAAAVEELRQALTINPYDGPAQRVQLGVGHSRGSREPLGETAQYAAPARRERVQDVG